MFYWLQNLLSPAVSVEEAEHIDTALDGPTVVWIHGAHQSDHCWRYLREKCNFKHELLVNYSSSNLFYENLESMIQQLKGTGPLFVVGHSLGGIYAAHLLKYCDIVAGVTISTPYRGSSAADWARYIYPQYPLFKEIGRRSRPVVEAMNVDITVPWTQIVSTKGNVPYMKTPNDGVCTIASMRSRADSMNCIEVDETHYEVMLSPQVVDIILEKYQQLF